MCGGLGFFVREVIDLFPPTPPSFSLLRRRDGRFQMNVAEEERIQPRFVTYK